MLTQSLWNFWPPSTPSLAFKPISKFQLALKGEMSYNKSAFVHLMGRDTQTGALNRGKHQHKLSRLTRGAWNNVYHMLPCFKLPVRSYEDAMHVCKFKEIWKGNCGYCLELRKKTHWSQGKKGKGELKLLRVKDFVKWQQKVFKKLEFCDGQEELYLLTAFYTWSTRKQAFC